MYTAEPGELFYFFAERMQEEMREKGQTSRVCIFNGITVTIAHNSNLEDICIIYNLKMKIA